MSNHQVDNLPGHRIREEPLLHVVLREELHANHGEYVNYNDQHERQITQCANRGDDDAQQDLHRGPGLGQL